MKKIIVIFFLFTSLHAWTQVEKDHSFFLGVNPGVSVSRVFLEMPNQTMFDLSTDQDFISGYAGGIVFIYYSEPRRGIQLELNYSQRGWTENLDSIYFYTRKLDYIEFPFLSHFDIGNKSLNFTITAGPAISYLLSSQEEDNLENDNLVKTYYHLEIPNKLEGGLCIGLGVNKFTPNGLIQLELRVHQGLSDLFAGEKNLEFSAARNQLVGLKMSYLFGW